MERIAVHAAMVRELRNHTWCGSGGHNYACRWGAKEAFVEQRMLLRRLMNHVWSGAQKIWREAKETYVERSVALAVAEPGSGAQDVFHARPCL